MAKTDYQSVDRYISTQPEEVQQVLEQSRQAIHEAAPEAEGIVKTRQRLILFSLRPPDSPSEKFRRILNGTFGCLQKKIKNMAWWDLLPTTYRSYINLLL